MKLDCTKEEVKRNKEILCIKVRDKIKRYCGDDIAQYIDLLCDGAILSLIKFKGTKDINSIAIEFIDIIFGISIDNYSENYIDTVIKLVDHKYSPKQLIIVIENINKVK
jgi:hypothetical protein